MRVLVVDGANVVGSRPDGWWRDRPGAAARLHARLGQASLDADTVILVLEGRARSGVPEGTVDGVRTVHATADGDTAMVDLVGALAAGVLVLAGIIGLGIWLPSGPLAKGWAAKAGTPTSLLGGQHTSTPRTSR